MVSRLLITTPLEETWSDAEPVLFLGEWCRLFARRARWSTLDAEVLPYHWDDRAKLEADFRYLSDLQERLLAELGKKLNEIHGVDHSLRYWRILVGPWLGYFIPVLFDRWESIQQAARDHAISGTIVLTRREDQLVPQDMMDFIRLFVGDEWNHHIYSEILRRYTTVRRVEKLLMTSTSPVPGGPPRVSAKRRVKAALAAWLSSGVSLMTRNHDAFVITSYLPPIDEIKLHWRLGQRPQYWPRVQPSPAKVEGGERRWKLDGESHSNFECAARELVAQQIPTIYLEGYHRLIMQTRELRWPTAPQLIWTSNSHNADDVFKAWAAEKVERGTPLVIGQHGGHFGIGRWNFEEDHEILISDRYLSWGWSKLGDERVLPLGQLKGKRPLDIHHASQPHALLVTCAFPRYSYWMFSALVAGQYLDYLEDQYAFLDALPGVIRDQIIVRLSVGETGWSQEARMRERQPSLRLDEGRASISDLIRQSRLYISTYNATTFLESFTMNVPTVIYWNPQHWELRDTAIPYFEDLRRVGIFHETPDSAARHVAAIWDDVDAWWTSKEVREVLERFTARYAFLPDNLLDRLEQALRGVTLSNLDVL